MSCNFDSWSHQIQGVLVVPHILWLENFTFSLDKCLSREGKGDDGEGDVQITGNLGSQYLWYTDIATFYYSRKYVVSVKFQLKTWLSSAFWISSFSS